MSPVPEHPTRPRIGLLDTARGVALIAMASYHFAWDLEFFRYIEAGTTAFGWWKMYARGIAGSFLFLVGFSLVLAHTPAIRWRPLSICNWPTCSTTRAWVRAFRHRCARCWPK